MRNPAITPLLISTCAVLFIACEKEPLATSDISEPQLAVTASGSDPAAPSNGAATVRGPTVIDFAWRDNSTNETGFEVQRSVTGPSGSFTLRAKFGAGGNLLNDGVKPSSQYCYRVRAVRTKGNKTFFSSFSNIACATSQPPPQPTLTADAVVRSQINLSWSFSIATWAELERSITGPAGPFVFLVRFPGWTSSHSDSGLQRNTQYCYRVRNSWQDSVGTVYSQYSNTACATTIGAAVAASNVNAMPAGSSEVAVDWSHFAGDINGFRVERSIAGGPWQSAATATPYERQLIVSATAEVTACYRVIAFNSLGDALPSNTDCTAPPNAPTNLTFTSVDAQTIRLGWNDNSGVEDGYEVWGNFVSYNQDCEAGCVDLYYSDIVAALPANSTTVTLPNTGAYSYYVVAVKDGGMSTPAFGQ